MLGVERGEEPRDCGGEESGEDCERSDSGEEFREDEGELSLLEFGSKVVGSGVGLEGGGGRPVSTLTRLNASSHNICGARPSN